MSQSFSGAISFTDNQITNGLCQELGVDNELNCVITFQPGECSLLRVGPLVIGSDHLAPWFIKQSQLSGADFYFALRLNNWNTSLKGLFKNDRVEQCFW